MSRNIFVLSQTYVNGRGHKSQKNIDEILRRHKIILTFLDEKYFLAKSIVFSDVMAALCAQGIQTTESAVRRDMTTYRLAYRYFHGEKNILDEGIVDGRSYPLQCLVRDGYDSWDKILTALDSIESEANDVLSIADQKKADVSLSTSPAFATKAEQVSDSIMQAVSALQETATLFVSYHDDLYRRERELVEIGEKNSEQEIYIADLRAINDGHIQEKIALQKKCKDLEEEKQVLLDINEEQGRMIKQQKKKIEDLLVAHRLMQGVFDGGNPQKSLTDDVIESQPTPCDEEEYMDTEDITTLQLPQLCLFCEKSLRYTVQFENSFRALSHRYQTTVARAITMLSEVGPEYSGLRTNKVQADYHNGRIKGGMMKSRAGRSYRFVWEVANDVINIVGLFHKNKIS